MQHVQVAQTMAEETREEIKRVSSGKAESRYLHTKVSARQGDLLIMRVGDSLTGMQSMAPTPAGGECLAAGNHGEHRLVADGFTRVSQDAFDVCGTAMLLHTDTRAGERHATIILSPGRWVHCHQRELRGEQIVEVRD